MQQYLNKLNIIFNQILNNHYDYLIWKEFGKIINECYENDIRFYYIERHILEVKDNDEMLRIKDEIEKLKQEKIEAIKQKSFDYAMKLAEQNDELDIQLDREAAKKFYKTENYFYQWQGYGIGFNFTDNKVIDFLMEHYSTDRYGLTQLIKI